MDMQFLLVDDRAEGYIVPVGRSWNEGIHSSQKYVKKARGCIVPTGQQRRDSDRIYSSQKHKLWVV
jgi:hypothetical protein